MLPTRESIFSSSSIITPRSTTLEWKTTPGNCCSSSCLSIFASWTRVPTDSYTAFCWGSASTDLKTSRAWTFVRVVCSSVNALTASFCLQCWYAWVSSAYCWTPTPASHMIWSTFAVKRTHRSGPRVWVGCGWVFTNEAERSVQLRNSNVVGSTSSKLF